VKRRDLLKSAAVLPAIAQAQQNAVAPRPTPARKEEDARLDSETPDATADPVPHFFTPQQFATLQKLSDTILPRIGETPGALDARVPEFLDFLISRSSADQQTLYRDGLNHPLDLTLLGEPWTYEGPRDPYAKFLQQAKHDILTAAANSREWIAAVAKRNPAVTGTGAYWLPVE